MSLLDIASVTLQGQLLFRALATGAEVVTAGASVATGLNLLLLELHIFHRCKLSLPVPLLLGAEVVTTGASVVATVVGASVVVVATVVVVASVV